MQKIVSNGLKIDLHIHSIASSHKDGAKVKNNTIDNIPLLIKKLNDQNVNICSITDHDTFSYDLYAALKQAESTENSIQKVLPGVEFSVCFFDGDRESVIHVIAIFSDEDEKKIQAIEELLIKSPPTYKLAYKEADFLDLLRRINELYRMKEKYNTRVQLIEAENSRMETVSKIIRKYSDKHRRGITDAQKRRSEFTENVAELKNQIIDLINVSNSIETYVPFVEYTKIRTNSNQVFDYEFISKLKIEEINTQYFLSLISRTLKAGKTINWMAITEGGLQDILLKYDNSPVLQFFSNALHVLIENDLQPQNSIIYQGMDRYAEMSSGLDAKIYFDLLSYEMQQDGIYIIDQPEDNISQNAIREYLLDRFKTMGENRQVIMVTHNPQFIVNLDVDNLIFLSKKDGLFSVQSGALEYACPEYSVLDIVARNIDGGLDSIRKRWKRYEKATEL